MIPAVELCNVTLHAGKRLLLRNASAAIGCGQLVALLGRNGTGKSTLLRSIAGLHRSYSGTISLLGNSNPTPAQRALTMAYVATGRIRLQSMRVRELVSLGRAPLTGWSGHLSPKDHEAVANAMKLTGITPMADRSIDTLSDGEAQRVMIARAIAQDTPVIMLDEPTSYLDIPARIELCRLLRSLADSGKCVIFTTHEIDLVKDFATNIALIHNQSLFFDTPKAINSIISSAFSI